MKTTFIIFLIFAVLFFTLWIADSIYKRVTEDEEDTIISLGRDFCGIGTVMLLAWLIMCIFC